MKKITFKLSVVFALFLCLSSMKAQDYWKKTDLSSSDIKQMQEINVPNDALVLSFNIEEFQAKLLNAPEGQLSGFLISLPDNNGNEMRFNVAEASVFEADLQTQYPEIRSYMGRDVKNSQNYLRFTVSPYNGVNGIIVTGDRSETIVIQDLNNASINKTAIYKRSNRVNDKTFTCDVVDQEFEALNFSSENFAADDSTLRTFEIAISTTGEYSAFHGGTLASVNAALATSLVRVNSVFELDFAVRLVLIGGNDVNIYLDGATDPYDSADDGGYNAALQNTLTTNVGNAYDVGHLYAGIGNNGNAGCIGCICVNGQKGSGYTTSTNPIGDRWDIDYVAHEIGHQFGGNHTFTHSVEGGIAQMEPGSGTTIMGYAGITGATDVQQVSDPYFHAVSIQQITTHAKSRTCDVESNTGNNIPVVNAGANLTLPIGTPFILTGSATDADAGDVLTYCWEQYDENNAANAYPSSTLADNNQPLFRSYSPSTGTSRTFPKLEDITNGVNGNTWEKVPTVARSADFRLTVRDNVAGGAGNSFDNMTVTWDAARGPLEVTSQAADGVIWDSGTTENITWDVNSTNTFAGASNVNILLSLDGGLSYSTTLLSNIPNNGAATITVPNTPAPYCRLMVQPTTAPFFAINTKDFSIDFEVTTDCSEVYTSNPNFAIPDNAGAYSGLGLTTTSAKTLGGGVSLKLGLDVTHTYLGDLQFLLQSPGGTQVIPFTLNTCGANDNMDIQLFDSAPEIVCGTPTTGDVKTANSFSAYDGEAVNGQWILGVVDAGAGDTGTLNTWTLTICETTETSLSVNDISRDNFVVYPNPTTGLVNVKLDTSNDVNINLFDIRGRGVYSEDFSNNNSKFNKQLDFSNLSAGIYMLNVKSGDKSFVKKIIIE